MDRERAPFYGFVGIEGSGKTKQARRLAEYMGLPYVSTGNMIRYAQENDFTDVGDKCRAMAATKTYLDGKTLLEMLSNELEKTPDGVILDGGFRTVEETKDFEEMLRDKGLDFAIRIIYLKVPDELGLRRILEGPDRGREDDSETDIRKRQARFRDGLEERIAFIKDHFVLIEVDGTKTEDQVHEDIVLLLQTIPASTDHVPEPSLQQA